MTITKHKEIIYTHENAIYAIENGLKRFRNYYKEVDQTDNFNSYIEFYKDYIKLLEAYDKLSSVSDYKSLRILHQRCIFLCRNKRDHDFPNLYHYALEDIKKLIDEIKVKAYGILPSYEFEVSESNGTVNDNNGLRVFKTPYEMCSSFTSHHDLDSTAKIIFNEKTYFPYDIKYCASIFKIIEENETNNSSINL